MHPITNHLEPPKRNSPKRNIASGAPPPPAPCEHEHEVVTHEQGALKRCVKCGSLEAV